MSSIESFTQPYRLQPYTEEESKKAVPKDKEYHVFQLYEKQLKSLGMKVPMEMQDYELSNFKNNISEEYPIERKINTMVRQLDVDRLGIAGSKDRRVEFMIWYENWTGYKFNGKAINGEDIKDIYTVLDFPRGLDKQINPPPTKYDKDGTPLKAEPGPHYWVHTIPFKPELIDKILEETTDTGSDTIQFIAVDGTGSWTKFSIEEFQYLTFGDLVERGKKGLQGGPVAGKRGK